MSETNGPSWPTDADLRTRLRRACAEADGFEFEALERHDYQKHADRLMAVIPAVDQYYAALRDRADAVARELHRRLQRLQDLCDDPERSDTVLEHVRGETIGLRAALGIFTNVPGSPRTTPPLCDHLGANYYREWASQALEGDETATGVTHGTGLQRRIAAAIHRYDNHHALSGNDIPSEHHHGEAKAVLIELLGSIPEGTDTATWTAVRAIQLMNEAGTQREAAEGRARALEERLRLTTEEKVANVVGPDIELLCEENARLRAQVAAARRFAEEMRDFCSPHGVAVDYADRLIEAMDRAKEEAR
ncbi:hypothetical protein ABZ383_27510 [Streptomyces sp. NPDC005900]|uniref:hypothetical protein n=1 Tax=Streptomyces sp. NPDC005900 TaxID=3154569 RepID=UPI003405A07F